MWKPIVGYESLYEVSDKGNVRSLHKRGRGKNGGLLKLWKSQQGYTMATLSSGGKTFVATTSRLVLQAFIGQNPPDKPYACHKNGNIKKITNWTIFIGGLTRTINTIEIYTVRPIKGQLTGVLY